MKTDSLSQSLEQSEPCPGCGSQLVYDPASAQLSCPYCHHSVAVEASQNIVVERDFDQWSNLDLPPEAALSQQALEVECSGCRAQITFEPPEVAGNCPFCNTHITAQPHAANPIITPEGILPFKVNQKTARNHLSKWLKSRWFAPSSLKHLAQHEKIQGVYLPFWTFDCQTQTRYSGERGTYYYVTKQRQVKNAQGETVTETYEDRRTRWHKVSGQVTRFFDDCLVPAIASVNVDHLKQLEPWGLNHLVAYDPKYLAGFRAQRYQVNLEQGFAQAKQDIQPQICSDIEHDIGGDEQRISSQSTSYSEQTFKHLLLPVWMATYRFRNQPYQVLVNGETGEVIGDRPYSVTKIALAIGAAAMAVLAFFLIVGLFAEEEPLPPATPQSSLVTGPSRT
jgi:ribosomal protein S27E